MAKDLRLDVVTDSDNKGLVEAAIGLNELANKADKAGNQMKETAVDGGFLAAELDRVKRKSLELAAAFNTTGDRAILKQISSNQRYESQLKRVGKELDAVGGSVEKEAEKIGRDLGKGAESGLQKWLSGEAAGGGLMGFLISPQGITAAVGAATLVGPMIGGAILAGIGTAGIGAGIAAELKDPAVSSALLDLKSTIGSTLKDAAKPFIAPTVAAFADLGNMISAEIGPGLKNMFTELAPELGVVVHGFGTFVSEIATGFERAAIASKPLLNVLGSQLLPKLGSDIEALFVTISHHAKEAQQGFELLFGVIELGIGIVNVGINVFSTLFDVALKGFNLWFQALHGVGIVSDGFMAKWDSWRGNNQAADSFNAGAGAAAIYAAATADATAKTKAFQDAFDALTGAISKDHALIDAKNQIAAIGRQLDKHSHSLDINTQAGRNNRSALEDSISALQNDRDALIKNGTSADDANKKFQGWVKALEKSAEKAGISKGAIDDLNRQLGLLPKKKDIQVNVHLNAIASAAIAAVGGILAKPHAQGGPFAGGDVMLVGEKGPELVKFDQPGTVIPNSALGSGSSSGGGRHGGITVEHLEIKAYSDRFSLSQVQQDLALHGVH